jgi:hypothetical protein
VQVSVLPHDILFGKAISCFFQAENKNIFHFAFLNLRAKQGSVRAEQVRLERRHDILHNNTQHKDTQHINE